MMLWIAIYYTWVHGDANKKWLAKLFGILLTLPCVWPWCRAPLSDPACSLLTLPVPLCFQRLTHIPGGGHQSAPPGLDYWPRGIGMRMAVAPQMAWDMPPRVWSPACLRVGAGQGGVLPADLPLTLQLSHRQAVRGEGGHQEAEPALPVRDLCQAGLSGAAAAETHAAWKRRLGLGAASGRQGREGSPREGPDQPLLVCAHVHTHTRKIPQGDNPTAPAEREPPPCSSGSLFLTWLLKLCARTHPAYFPGKVQRNFWQWSRMNLVSHCYEEMGTEELCSCSRSETRCPVSSLMLFPHNYNKGNRNLWALMCQAQF